MPQMYYKAQDGTLIPMGKPGPQGPAGPAGPAGPPGPGGLSQADADARYVNQGGDEMTGNLGIVRNYPVLALNGTPGAPGILLQREGVNRWDVGADDAYNFQVARRDAAGTFLDTPLRISTTDGGLSGSRSTQPGDTDKTLVTKDYVDQWINTPTLMTIWDRTAWPAGAWSELTMIEANSPGTGGSSHSARDCFDQLESGKPYFRIKKAGLYMVSGTMGWSWSGDGYSFPITGVFRAPANSQFKFGIWANQPNGGPAIERCFGYPQIDGGDQTHILGNTLQANSIGAAPTSINARLSIIRLGE